MRFKIHEGHFPLLIIRKRGPLNIPYIIQRAQNIEHFMDLLKNNFTKRAILKISLRTKSQSESNYWYLYRRCVISGTLCKRVIAQNCKNETNEKLNRSITKPFKSTFTNEAMTYGITNEQKALDLCLKNFAQKHKNAKMIKTGLVLHKDFNFIGGSPDGVLTCDCCLKPFLVEVKCPFRLKETGLTNWSILEYFNINQTLKTSHTYFNQINLYQGLLQIETAFFVVYAKNEIIVKTINFDKVFFDYQIKNICEYYFKHYLPKILGKKYKL